MRKIKTPLGLPPGVEYYSFQYSVFHALSIRLSVYIFLSTGFNFPFENCNNNIIISIRFHIHIP